MILTPLEQAEARQRTYNLFGRLYAEGLTADLHPYLQAIPELAAVLPDPFDPDEAAAAYQDLFGFNIFPNAAIFLDSSRLLGGPIANQHAELYRQTRFSPASAVEPDHISQCLAFLAHLSAAETNEIAAGKTPTIPTRQQHYFLETHFLPWLLPLTIAVQQQANPFYAQLTTLTLDLTANHQSERQSTQSTNQPITILPNYQSPITNPNTGLRDIARYLVTPVLSGIYLGRNNITQIARRLNLPHGFGSRDQMLQTLLQSAGQYETADKLFAALQDFLTAWQQAYQQIAQDHPTISHHLPPWQNRLQQTQHLLAEMEEKIVSE